MVHVQAAHLVNIYNLSGADDGIVANGTNSMPTDVIMINENVNRSPTTITINNEHIVDVQQSNVATIQTNTNGMQHNTINTSRANNGLDDNHDNIGIVSIDSSTSNGANKTIEKVSQERRYMVSISNRTKIKKINIADLFSFMQNTTPAPHAVDVNMENALVLSLSSTPMNDDGDDGIETKINGNTSPMSAVSPLSSTSSSSLGPCTTIVAALSIVSVMDIFN